MKSFLFALKRLLTTPWFTIFLLLILLAPFFAQRAAGDVAVPAPVFCIDGEADSDAERIAACLEEAGFLRVSSEEAVREAVAAGSADAGVIVPGNISALFNSGETEHAAAFVKSPNSLLPDLWQEHAAAALFTVYAPYIMKDALDGSGLSEDEIFEAYYACLDRGLLFSFEIESEKGKVDALSDRQNRFFLGVTSLLLFAAVFYAAAEPLYDETMTLSARIGLKEAVRSLLLPGTAMRCGLLWLAAAGAALLCGRPGLLLPLLAYILALLVFGLVLKVLPGRNWQGLLCLFLLLLSLAACPIYTDLSLTMPFVAWARAFLPPYWLWVFAG